MSTNVSIECRARALYRQSCQKLPAHARRSLRSVRLEAVATRPTSIVQRLLMPIGAVAASVLVLVVMWSYIPTQTRYATAKHGNATITSAPTADADTEAETELYQNLDFYRWLASRTEQPPARN